jgi:hypothetical protein
MKIMLEWILGKWGGGGLGCGRIQLGGDRDHPRACVDMVKNRKV